jgi:hypothetical protein
MLVDQNVPPKSGRANRGRTRKSGPARRHCSQNTRAETGFRLSPAPVYAIPLKLRGICGRLLCYYARGSEFERGSHPLTVCVSEWLPNGWFRSIGRLHAGLVWRRFRTWFSAPGKGLEPILQGVVFLQHRLADCASVCLTPPSKAGKFAACVGCSTPCAHMICKSCSYFF